MINRAIAACLALTGAISAPFKTLGLQQMCSDTVVPAVKSGEIRLDDVDRGAYGESVGYDTSVSCGEGADRPSLDLPGVQLDLLAALIGTGKRAQCRSSWRPLCRSSLFSQHLSRFARFQPGFDSRAALRRPLAERGH